MNKTVLTLLFCSAALFKADAQRAMPPLDTTVFSKWEKIFPETYPAISPDGGYFLYRKVYGQSGAAAKLILRKVTSGAEKQIADHWNSAQFSKSGRYLYFIQRDTLNACELAKGTVRKIPSVSGFYLSGDRLAFFQHEKPAILNLLVNGTQIKPLADRVTRVFSSRESPDIILVQSDGSGAQICVVDRSSNQLRKLATADTVKSGAYFSGRGWFFFGGKGKKEFLITFDQASSKPASISYQLPEKLRDKYETDAPMQISTDAKRLLFSVKQSGGTGRTEEDNPAGVSIWNYQEARMKYLYGARTDTLWAPLCEIDLHSGNTGQLTNEHERMISYGARYPWIIKSRGQGDLQEDDWNRLAGWTIQSRGITVRKIEFDLSKPVAFSPSGRQLLSFNYSTNGFELLDAYTGKRKAITQGISTNWFSGAETLNNIPLTHYSDARWTPDENWLFLRDHRDIWQIDASGKRPAICLTRHFGEKNGLVFSFLQSGPVDMKGEILLFGQDINGLASGFYRAWPSVQKDPEKLYNARGLHQVISHQNGSWVVMRSRADSGVSYLLSNDLKSFSLLAACGPPAAYNWLVTEMHTYRDSTGKVMRGVLFKPQDFSEKKSYPLILSCYQRIDNTLNEFPDPSHAPGNLNIPWMVSHGYLVFVPDIINEYNKGGESALGYIMGAFSYLSSLPFVKPGKIGVSGHSYGGFETTYAITHTGVFAAAYAGSPITDMVLNYTLAPGLYHHGQTAIGPLLWDDPRPYFENSPLFSIHKVTTPLLLMGNKEDFLAPQALGFYNAMRRLGKRCWMLQYQGMDHTIYGPASIDHTLRVQQYFDHYLKGLPVPGWMLQPGSISMQKSTKNQQPGRGVLTDEAQCHADSLMTRPLRTVEF